MIIIYTQDVTYIKENTDAAKDIRCSVYGDKLGKEAYNAVNKSRIGASCRKNDGPLVQFVSNEKAAVIPEKKIAIGMIKDGLQ